MSTTNNPTIKMDRNYFTPENLRKDLQACKEANTSKYLRAKK